MELPEAIPRPVPPSVTQEATLNPPGIKDPPAGAEDQYRDVLTLLLVGMFNGWVGHPETIKRGKEPNTDAYKRESQWKRHPGSEASAEEEEGEGDGQELLADEAGQEVPGTGSGQIDQILESINALAAREARNLAAGGEATTSGVPQVPRDTHPYALGRSVCDPFLRATNPVGQEGP